MTDSVVDLSIVSADGLLVTKVISKDELGCKQQAHWTKLGLFPAKMHYRGSRQKKLPLLLCLCV